MKTKKPESLNSRLKFTYMKREEEKNESAVRGNECQRPLCLKHATSPKLAAHPQKLLPPIRQSEIPYAIYDPA